MWQVDLQLGKSIRKVSRKQSPIVEAMAMTIHKSQGITHNNIAFHIPRNFLTWSKLYVGCSRATSAKALQFENFPSNPPKPCVKVVNEMQRLRSSKNLLTTKFFQLLTFERSGKLYII